MSAAEFVAKWRPYTGKETSGYISHFDDLCRLLGHETPAEADPSQSFFCFQKSLTQQNGRPGFADVYYQRHFGWEYKGNHRDLDAAYQQLLRYRENLANPALLIVSDFQRIIIRTNFTNTVTRKHEITLDDLLSGEPVSGTSRSAIELLRCVFYSPADLNPGQTRDDLTREAAERFARLADVLRGVAATERRRREELAYSDEQIARFLTRLIFCFFASDVGLLPSGIVSQIVRANRNTSPALAEALSELFEKMSTGGRYGPDPIPYFNGGLFSDSTALRLWSNEVDVLLEADALDWANIEPSIFGTLFERVLDPARRRQIGAHYTSRDDIELLVKPVLMEPLEREWEPIEKQVGALNLLKTGPGVAERKAKARALLDGFLDRLSRVRVLDPACGSGNFLYVSLALLKGLEQKVIAAGATWGIRDLVPRVHPRQLHGIEVDPYAHELASMVVWIGYLQWKHKNGIPFETETPILEPLTNIRLMDAVLDLTDPDKPREPEWPEADVIVGNPPFLGDKLLRTNLGDRYVDRLFSVWDGRVRREADFCCYWFEKARSQIEHERLKRAGLLATQAIRNRASRATLRRIKESGDIFFGVSDRQWTLNGANVRISMIGFDNGTEHARLLDGKPVITVNEDLTATVDIRLARRLSENFGIAFIGDTKKGQFDIPANVANKMLVQPNPHGRPNSEVIKPWVNGLDVTKRPRQMWIIDFSVMPESEAALYEAPYEYIRVHVKPARALVRNDMERRRWWKHARPASDFRLAVKGHKRFIATANLAKYRLFIWLGTEVLPDHQLTAFARQDDYFFGVLQSRAHETWALAQGTQQESRPRYTPSSTFETFPLPWPPGHEPKDDPRVTAIAAAAAELDRLRSAWLNPPDGSLDEAALKLRTLTNLYNQRPTWLDNAHRTLDAAVFAAYGWPADLAGEEVLARLLALNLQRATG